MYCLRSQVRNKRPFEKRLIHATSKNIKTAILLSPGPVATHLTTRSMSSSFKIAITKPKFLTAASQLQDDGYGRLVVLTSISASAHVFVKKWSADIVHLLNADSELCTLEEYETQYNLPPFTYITDKMQEVLVAQGYVPAGHFKLQTVTRRTRVVKVPQNEILAGGLAVNSENLTSGLYFNELQ